MNQMALAALKTQHKNFVQSMFDEGVLDNQFSQLQALQDSSNPNFVDEVITLFCNDAERIITDLNRYLNYQIVDFSKLDFYVHQLKGSSSSIGAYRLKLACVSLRQASEVRNKEECAGAFNSIRREYCLLLSKFQVLMQLERRIVALETSQHELMGIAMKQLPFTLNSSTANLHFTISPEKSISASYCNNIKTSNSKYGQECLHEVR